MVMMVVIIINPRRQEDTITDRLLSLLQPLSLSPTLAGHPTTDIGPQSTSKTSWNESSSELSRVKAIEPNTTNSPEPIRGGGGRGQECRCRRDKLQSVASQRLRLPLKYNEYLTKPCLNSEGVTNNSTLRLPSPTYYNLIVCCCGYFVSIP